MLIEIVAYEYMDFIRKVWRKTLEIFFPAICISCSKNLSPTEDNNLLCKECFDSIEILEEDRKTRVHSIGVYSSKPLRDLIHALKFKRYLRAMAQIGELIDKYLEKNPDSLLKTCDLITFIPLHPRREKNRGFNQADLIAKTLGNKLDVEVKTTLRRVRDTKEQSLIKDPRKRLKNIKGCFVVKDTITLREKRIILVDDVHTSGATINEAVETLHQAGVEKVRVFVLARAK